MSICQEIKEADSPKEAVTKARSESHLSYLISAFNDHKKPFPTKMSLQSCCEINGWNSCRLRCKHSESFPILSVCGDEGGREAKFRDGSSCLGSPRRDAALLPAEAPRGHCGATSAPRKGSVGPPHIPPGTHAGVLNQRPSTHLFGKEFNQFVLNTRYLWNELLQCKCRNHLIHFHHPVSTAFLVPTMFLSSPNPNDQFGSI